MRILLNVLVSISFINFIHGQDTTRKVLDHSDFLIWKTIQDNQLSADGGFTTYRLVPGEGDPILNIYTKADQTTQHVDRTSKSNIDYEGKFIYGTITPHRDSLRNLERKKIEKTKWPCDHRES